MLFLELLLPHSPTHILLSFLLLTFHFSIGYSLVQPTSVQRHSSSTGNAILSFALVATRDLQPGDELWTTKPPTNPTIAAQTPTLQDYELVDQLVKQLEHDLGRKDGGLTHAEWIGT